MQAVLLLILGFCFFSALSASVKVKPAHQLFKTPLTVVFTYKDDKALICLAVGPASLPTFSAATCQDQTKMNRTLTSTAIIRAQAFDTKGKALSDISLATFVYLPDVQKELDALNKKKIGTAIYKYYQANLEKSLLSIPILSVVVPKSVWMGLTQDSPLPVSIEAWNGLDFQVYAGAKYFGGASINYEKKSFRTYFSPDYGGPKKLEEPLFEGYERGQYVTKKFDELYWRSGSQDSFTVPQLDRYPSEIRNLWIDDMFRSLGHQTPHGRFFHVFFNGSYNGLFHLRERFDASFMADYFGGDKADYEAVNSAVPFDGTGQVWNNIIIKNRGNFNHIRPYLDTENFVDYHLLNWYAGNMDWPGHNWIGAAPTQPNRGGYKFFNSDSDTLFGNRPSVTIKQALDYSQIGTGIGATINGQRVDVFAALFNEGNIDFIQQLYDSSYKLFYKPGALVAYPNTKNLFEYWESEASTAIIAESMRWPKYNYGRNETWVPYLNRLKMQYFPFRDAKFLNLLEKKKFVSKIGAPKFSQRTGQVAVGYQLVITNPGTTGSIIYTVDGSDPRLNKGAISALAVRVTGKTATVIINTTTTVRARIYVDAKNWSPLDDVTLKTSLSCWGTSNAVQCPTRGNIKVTEIMHTPEGGEDGLDFIELKNVGTFTYNFNQAQFTDGIIYSFPTAAVLAPGQFYVIAADPYAFHERYGFYPNGGQFQGGLSKGEKVVITDGLNRTIVSVSYDSKKPWPTLTADGGFSLVPVDPNVNPDEDNSTNWRASSRFGGSPGKDDPPPLPPTLFITEVGPNATWIEINNPTNKAINLTGWSLSDSKSDPLRFVFNNSFKLLNPGSFRSVSNHGLNINSDGENVYIFPPLSSVPNSFEVGPNDPILSYGKITLSTGEARYRLLSSPTPEAVNSPVKVGPLVIEQIHHTPTSGKPQFIRLFNRSPNISLNRFKLAGSLSFSFPDLSDVAYAYVTTATPGNLRDAYGLNESNIVLGPWSGSLTSSSSLKIIETQYNRLIDEVAPKPSWGATDGTTLLSRTWTMEYGDDIVNWQAVLAPIVVPPPNDTLPGDDPDPLPPGITPVPIPVQPPTTVPIVGPPTVPSPDVVPSPESIPSPENVPAPSNSSESGPNVGLIVGLTVGLVGGLLVVGAIAYVVFISQTSSGADAYTAY